MPHLGGNKTSLLSSVWISADFVLNVCHNYTCITAPVDSIRLIQQLINTNVTSELLIFSNLLDKIFLKRCWISILLNQSETNKWEKGGIFFSWFEFPPLLTQCLGHNLYLFVKHEILMSLMTVLSLLFCLLFFCVCFLFIEFSVLTFL